MVVKSHGKHRRTRSKFRKGPKDKFTVNKYIKNLKEGNKVAIVIDSSSKGMPFRRFHGLTGKVIGKRGRSYIIEIKDIKKKKQIIAKPEHLKVI